jgi:hypothetical protein
MVMGWAGLTISRTEWTTASSGPSRALGEQGHVGVGVATGGGRVGAVDDVEDLDAVGGGHGGGKGHAVVPEGRSQAPIRSWSSAGKTFLGMTACTALAGMELYRYVEERQARAELTRVNREIKRLRAELAALEEQRSKLSSSLGE